MRILKGLLRRTLFIINKGKIEKHSYDGKLVNAGWLSSIILPNYGVLAFEDTEGHYHFTW